MLSSLFVRNDHHYACWAFDKCWQGSYNIIDTSWRFTSYNFYKNIDLQELGQLLPLSRCIFGPDPVEIINRTRSGNYYNYKTNNPECKELIKKIINLMDSSLLEIANDCMVVSMLQYESRAYFVCRFLQGLRSLRSLISKRSKGSILAKTLFQPCSRRISRKNSFRRLYTVNRHIFII